MIVFLAWFSHVGFCIFQEKNKSEQISWLIEHVRQGDAMRFDGFVEALQDDKQGHIVTGVLQPKPSQSFANNGGQQSKSCSSKS